MKERKQNKNVIAGYKVNILDGIKEAIEEVKLIKLGKLKGIPAKDLLKELSD